MATRTRRHDDQAIDARLQRLLRMAHIDHVMKDHAAVAVHGIHDFARRRAQRGDDDRHLVLYAGFHVLHQAPVGAVRNLVDRNRPHRLARVGRPVSIQIRLHLVQPLAQQLGLAGVERRERAHDAGLALRQHQLGIADGEHRRCDDGQRQVLQRGGDSGRNGVHGRSFRRSGNKEGPYQSSVTPEALTRSACNLLLLPR